MAVPQILVGTAGWSYPDWANVVYPSAKAVDHLCTVVRYMDCVEVDSSFYRPPSPQTAAKWVKATAAKPGFRFLAKAWQRFTHKRATLWTQAEYDVFTRGLAPLREAGRLDALLFQFPWSFRNDARNRDWLAHIAGAFTDWPVAVELRHDSWLGDAADGTLKFFRAWCLTFCNVDQPALGHCIPPTAHTTSDTGYYRLHGRNARNWFREEQNASGERYDYLYSEAELAELEPKIRQVAARVKKTFVIFNNHKDAKAFSNALQMKARLSGGAKLRVPATLMQRYPKLRVCGIPDGDEQLLLV